MVCEKRKPGLLRACVIAAAFAFLFSVPAEAKTVQVKMNDMGFSPAVVTVDAGDTVEWANSDFVAHSATATNKKFDVMVMPNASKGLFAPITESTDYYCRFHPTMKGKIIVKAAEK